MPTRNLSRSVGAAAMATLTKVPRVSFPSSRTRWNSAVRVKRRDLGNESFNRHRFTQINTDPEYNLR